MLKITNISKTYSNDGKRIEAVKDFSLSLDEHKFIGLVGPSGCGKTTLLKIIAGLIPASGGNVVLDGQKIFESGKRSWFSFSTVYTFPVANGQRKYFIRLLVCKNWRAKRKPKSLIIILALPDCKILQNFIPKIFPVVCNKESLSLGRLPTTQRFY